MHGDNGDKMSRNNWTLHVRRWLAAFIPALLLAACGGSSDRVAAVGIPPADGGTAPASAQVKVLSTRPDLVSGEQAYVEVVLPQGASDDGLKVSLGERDLSADFPLRANGRRTGLVTGLQVGNNLLSVSGKDFAAASLMLVDHPIGGPVISGAQLQPWVCATPRAVPATPTTPASNASGLSASAVDAQCNIPSEFTLFYRSTTAGCSTSQPDPSPPSTPSANNCFKPYDPTAAAPADLATTTTDTGLTVPYIVRVQRGTLNRGIYDIAVLYDPAQDWQPYAPQAGWNGKLLYAFGSNTGQPRRQSRSSVNWADDASLSRGFMVAVNSLTDSGLNSDRDSMAETMMMMKEHIVDTFGEIRYTIGVGGSGGAINQNNTTSILPGLLDGLQLTANFPDSETTGIEVSDCQALVNYYASPAFATLTTGIAQPDLNAMKAAINGHVDQTGCHAWVNNFGNLAQPGNYIPRFVLDNTVGTLGPKPGATPTNNCQLAAPQVYDAMANPAGARCGVRDAAVSVWGTAPGSVLARDTGDNTGVQYGLKALQAGAITMEQFVSINEGVGSVDTNGNPSAARAAADPTALDTAYASGLVAEGASLANVAIIDVRGNDNSNIQLPGTLGIHHIWRSFSLRDRLDKDNGQHDNHVMWRHPASAVGGAPAASGLLQQSFIVMDQWLAAVEADKTDGTRAQKIARDKPAAAVDFCYLSADTGFTTKVFDKATCDADPLLKPYASPRQVAGGPRAEDILKCTLKPLDVAEYLPAVPSPTQLNRLEAVFPNGVCDWSQPGVGQKPAQAPETFEAGPGGKPLGAVPASSSAEGGDSVQRL
jgi:hypothetical protein